MVAEARVGVTEVEAMEAEEPAAVRAAVATEVEATVEATEAEATEVAVTGAEAKGVEAMGAVRAAGVREGATAAMVADQATGAPWHTASDRRPPRAPSTSLHDHAADCRPIGPSAASCAPCRRPPCATPRR